MRLKILALFIFMASAALSAAQTPDYQVSVSTVTVWVKATDKSGQPVAGLKQEDFDIFEDNTRVAPACFEEVDVLTSTSPDDTTSAAVTTPQGQPKKFVLYLDLLNTSVPEYNLVAPRLKEFLQRLNGKNVQMMAVALSPNSKIALLSGFTNDMNRISMLLDQAKPNITRDQEVRNNESRIVALLDDLKETDDVQMESIEDITSAGQDPGFRDSESRGSRGPIDREQNARLIQGAIRMAEGFSNQERYQSELSLRALEGFAEYLAKQITREHLVMIYVSGGFNADPGRRYYEVIGNAVDRYNLRRDADRNPRYGANNREERFRLRELVEQSVGKLNRMNVTLYSINTRGMAISDNLATKPELATDMTKILPDYQESLTQIARETGGVAFLNSQNFKVGFDNIVQDIQHYYLICYSAPEHKVKGQYHKIKIASKKGGVQIRHRNGYFD